MKLKILKASRAACLCTTICFAVVSVKSLAGPQELLTGAVGELHRAQAAEGVERAAHLEAALAALTKILRDYPESEFAAQLRGAGVPVFGGDSISIESVQRELGLPVLNENLLGAADGWPSSIAGNYSVQGRNPNGSTYSGTLPVSRIEGDIYEFRWSIAGQTYRGRGAWRDGRISVDYGGQHPAVYSWNENGYLDGSWAGGSGKERLIPSDP